MKTTLKILCLALILSACSPRTKEVFWTSVMEAELNHVSAVAGGRIMKLNVKEGDEVKQGDLLATLDDQELRYTLEQMEASLRELDAQEKLLLTQIAIAEVELNYQNGRFSRTERLYQEAIIPLQSYEDTQIMQSKAELQLSSSKQNLSLLTAKRSALVAQGNIIRKKLADCIIVSPFNGRIETLFFNEGEMIPSLGKLAQISNIDYPEANIYVNEEWLAHLKLSMPLMIRLQSRTEPIPAQVICISNKAEFTPKTVLTPDNRSVMVYAVRIRAENPEGILKDGMPVDIFVP